MDGWLALLGAFPVVVFAGLSALCLVYWLLVMIGAADLDALDGVTGKAEGAVKGVVEGAAHAAAHAAHAATGAVKGSTSAFTEALSALGLTQVPFTISLSVFSLLGLLASALTRNALDDVVPGVIAALAATVAGVVGGVAATVAVTRPLRGLFKDSAGEQGGASLVGKTCVVTIDADDQGGQARAGEVIVRVRVIAGHMARDEEALILERADDGVFVIEPLRKHLPSTDDAFAGLAADAAAVVEEDAVTSRKR